MSKRRCASRLPIAVISVGVVVTFCQNQNHKCSVAGTIGDTEITSSKQPLKQEAFSIPQQQKLKKHDLA